MKDILFTIIIVSTLLLGVFTGLYILMEQKYEHQRTMQLENCK